jgi:hypothetical protein
MMWKPIPVRLPTLLWNLFPSNYPEEAFLIKNLVISTHWISREHFE